MTLADGTQRTVLAPQLYVRVRDGDVLASGALIAADDLQLHADGDIVNGGTLAGRSIARIDAHTIDISSSNVAIAAASAGADSDLTVRGSTIAAGSDLTLTADDAINLLAAQNTYTQKRSNRSSSAGVGVAISYGSNGAAFGITANASAGRGSADGKDVSHTNTHVAAGDTLTLQSGGDTNLKGALASGKQVTLDAGGDLNIQSLQDTSTYESKQRNAGGSVTIGYGFAGSANFSQTDIDSEFASVIEQSGVKAGDEGFQIEVAGNTDLKGAVIASTDKAVEDGKNRLTTGTLTTNDIQNRAKYKASASGVALGIGSQGGVPNLSGAGVGFDEGKAASVTKSAIGAGAVDITDSDAQQTLTGQDADTTIALLNRDVHMNEAGEVVDGQGRSTTNALTKIFDAEKVAEEINAQVQITQAFSQQAHQALDGYVQTARTTLRGLLKDADSEEDREIIQKQLDQLLLEERVMNVLIGAVTGSGGSAVTKESLSAAAAKMYELSLENSKLFDGIVDIKSGFVLTNLKDGKSEGLRGNGISLAGTRSDLDLLCGGMNERCVTQIDPVTGIPIFDENGIPKLVLDTNNKVQFDPDKAGYESLIQFLETSEEGKQMAGATGGIQGWVGTLFGRPYPPGGWEDKLVTAFAGTHDYIGGQMTRLYDEQGNIKRGMSDLERNLYDYVVSPGALVPSIPFAAAEFLPPEIWAAIATLIGVSR